MIMAGFFTVTDVPARRVVQYKRVSSSVDGAVYIADESVLGTAVDVAAMPYAALTGVSVDLTGNLFEVPYLEDAGAVYFATQPVDSAAGVTLTVEAKAGTAPYTYQWYKDDKQVVNVPDSGASLVASDAGSYYCVATDAGGAQAVSKAAVVSAE